MKLSAESVNAVKLGLLMLLFSFLVLMAYAAEKKIIDNLRKNKTGWAMTTANSIAQADRFNKTW